MQHTVRRARPAATLATLLGLALTGAVLAPGAALAATTEPPVTTTTTAPTPTESTGSTSPSGTTSSSTTPPGTTTTGTAVPPTVTATTGTTVSGTAALTTSPPTTTAAPTARIAAAATSSEQVPFGAVAARIAPGTPVEQAGYAGGFIVRTLAARGDHYNYPSSTIFDGGNTIDAVLALDGAKVGLSGADAAMDYLADHVNDYVGYPDPSDPSSPETYAGPLGKLVLGVVAHGGDPSDFGGQDLVARLQGLLTPGGRFSDQSNFGDPSNPTGDYSNTIGQALDVIALGRATGSVPDSAADFLLAQQCADGGFRGNLDDAAAPCTSDTDATGFAAQALVGLFGASDPRAVEALTYLSTRQAANGGFLNDDGQYNANTAGVAAQAFAAGGFAPQLARAQSFLAGLQLDCTAAVALRGGIAFTAADLATLTATPTNTAAIDRALRATPQATLGLAGGSLLTVTADGAATTAPTLACATTSTTTTTTTTTVASPTSSAPAASATPGSLALTGSDVAPLLLLAVGLLCLGAGALAVAGRKGAHA